MESQTGKKKKNDRRYRPWIIGFAIVAGVLALLVLGAFYLVQKTADVFSDMASDYTGEEARPFIEDALKITLPDSVSNMRFFYSSWLDFDMRMKFDIAPDDLPLLLDDLSLMCFEQPLQEGINPFTSVGEDWWQPASAIDALGAEQCGDNPFWFLLVDRATTARWTVYIEAYST